MGLSRIWLEIGSHSLDKYYYIARKIQSLQYTFLLEHKWDDNLVQRITDIYGSAIFGTSEISDGIKFHLARSFYSELNSALDGCEELPLYAFQILITQFRTAFISSNNYRLLMSIGKHVFSELGTQKFNLDKEKQSNVIKNFLNNLIEENNLTTKKINIIKNALTCIEPSSTKRHKFSNKTTK